MALTNAYFGMGTGEVLLDQVKCSGTETKLTTCTSDKKSFRCTHSEDAGVRCPGKNEIKLQTSILINDHPKSVEVLLLNAQSLILFFVFTLTSPVLALMAS